MIQADVNQSEKMLNEAIEEIRAPNEMSNWPKTTICCSKKNTKETNDSKAFCPRSELDVAERGLLTSQTQLTARKNTLDMMNARKNEWKHRSN